MNDEFRQMVIDALRRGEDLPAEWAREPFPPEKREYELVCYGKAHRSVRPPVYVRRCSRLLERVILAGTRKGVFSGRAQEHGCEAGDGGHHDEVRPSDREGTAR